MKVIAIKLTTPDEIRAACDMAVLMGEEQFQVMYKPEQAEDDDYVGVDLGEFSEARNNPEEFEEFCGGRHSWELWVYERQTTRGVDAVETIVGTPGPPVPDKDEALLLAASYIQYVKARDPDLHREANGTPSIEQMVAKAVGRAA